MTEITRSYLAEYAADDRLRAKAALRQAALPILEIPSYLAKHDDLKVQNCLDLVRRMIRESP